MRTNYNFFKYALTILFFLALTPGNFIHAQEIEGIRIDETGNVGVGTLTPHESAKLHVHSYSKGVLIPRMTWDQMQAITPKVEGLIVYRNEKDSDINGPYYWDSFEVKWIRMDATEVKWMDIGGDPNNTSFWQLNGNSNTDINSFLGTNSTDPLRIGANSNEVVTVKHEGRVGINNTNPQTDLDVNGYAKIVDENNNLVLNSSSPNSMVTNNIYIGEFAGDNNMTDWNYFIGYKAGMNNQGVANTAIGWQAGYNATGKWNAFLGILAGQNSTGHTNVFGGRYSGNGSSLIESIAFGHQAGLGSGGSYNIFMGYGAGKDVNNSHNVAIGLNTLSANSGTEKYCFRCLRWKCFDRSQLHILRVRGWKKLKWKWNFYWIRSG